jgi:serine/threonine protein kinase/tetratricopeptide (TPR) repeat protein
MVDQDKSAEHIFGEALDLEPEHRSAFLDQACRGAPGLRLLVDELLLQDQRAGSFLGKPLFVQDDKYVASTAVSAAPSARFAPAQLIANRFKIVRFIARGGMGEVYEASDVLLQQARVALKIIRPEIAADTATTSRFEQEVILARTVVHPNLCPIYEIFRCEGPGPPFLFLTMRLLQGDTLDARLKTLPKLSSSESLEICTQLISGVAALHSAGIIHRDLKPKNVMLEQTGQHIKVSITDFGLARLHEAESTMLGSGMVAGTPAYMAPELFRGERPTKATDLYALGIVLHQVLTGECPIESEGLLVPSPSLRSVHAPSQLIQAVESFLALDPKRRSSAFERVKPAQDSVGSPSRFSVSGLLHARALWYGTAGFVALVALGVAVVYWWGQRRPAARSIQSLAVLPLDNLSGDPNQDYLSDGMTDVLITSLGQIGSLRVISHTTAMQYKNAHKPLPQIARELNVDAVVEGSVLRSGDKIRIGAQLVAAPAEKQLWAQNYDGDMRDVLGLQSRVASAVAEQIRIKLTPKEQTQLANTQDVDPRAYEALLKGNYFFRENSNATTQKALQYFLQAVELDPKLARAYVGIARCYNFLGQGVVTAAEATAASDSAIAKALQLQPDLGEVYEERGWTLLFYHWDFSGAERDFRHALELNPGSSDAHEGYGTNLVAMGQFDEGLEQMKKARDLDPLSPFRLADYCVELTYARRYGEAVTQCLAALELDPNFNWGLENIANTYLLKGDYAKAHQVLAKLGDCDAACMAMLDETSGAAGKSGAFDSWLKTQKDLPDAFFLAQSYAGLGRKDQALASLEKAYQLRSDPHGMAYTAVDPHFDRIRADPRFDAFLRHAGLPAQPHSFAN